MSKSKAGALREGYREARMGNGRPAQFLTKPAGVLRIAGSADMEVEQDRIRFAYRFDVVQGSNRTSFDVIRCRLRTADADGALWEAESFFTPEVFLERLVDLEDMAMWPACRPEKARERPPKDCLLWGVRGWLDDGAWRHFLVEGKLVSVHFRYQAPLFDLYAGPSGFGFQVRGLRGVSRPVRIEDHSFVVPVQPGAPFEEGPVGLIDGSLSYRDLLFRNTSFFVDDGFFHGSPIPIPQVFQRVEGKGEPQPAVTHRPFATR